MAASCHALETRETEATSGPWSHSKNKHMSSKGRMLRTFRRVIFKELSARSKEDLSASKYGVLVRLESESAP